MGGGATPSPCVDDYEVLPSDMIFSLPRETDSPEAMMMGAQPCPPAKPVTPTPQFDPSQIADERFFVNTSSVMEQLAEQTQPQRQQQPQQQPLVTKIQQLESQPSKQSTAYLEPQAGGSVEAEHNPSNDQDGPQQSQVNSRPVEDGAQAGAGEPTPAFDTE